MLQAVAEWDDRAQLYRVFVEREDADEFEPMTAVHDFDGDDKQTPEGRIYRAAFVKCPKDFRGLTVGDPIGWPKKAPADRVARAVNAEIKRMHKGLPGPTSDVVRLVLAFTPWSRK